MVSRYGRGKGGILAVIVLAGLLGTTAVDAAGGKTDSERITELEKRVAELEALLKQALDSGSQANTADLQRKIDLLTEELERSRMGEAAGGGGETGSVYGLGPAASKVYGAGKGVSIGGYGEMLYQDYAAERDDGTRSGETSTRSSSSTPPPRTAARCRSSSRRSTSCSTRRPTSAPGWCSCRSGSSTRCTSRPPS